MNNLGEVSMEFVISTVFIIGTISFLGLLGLIFSKSNSFGHYLWKIGFSLFIFVSLGIPLMTTTVHNTQPFYIKSYMIFLAILLTILSTKISSVFKFGDFRDLKKNHFYFKILVYLLILIPILSIGNTLIKDNPGLLNNVGSFAFNIVFGYLAIMNLAMWMILKFKDQSTDFKSIENIKEPWNVLTNFGFYLKYFENAMSEAIDTVKDVDIDEVVDTATDTVDTAN